MCWLILMVAIGSVRSSLNVVDSRRGARAKVGVSYLADDELGGAVFGVGDPVGGGHGLVATWFACESSPLTIAVGFQFSPGSLMAVH